MKALRWARQLGTALYDAAQAVAVDPAGNVYVAGLTEGDIDGSGVPVATCSGGTSRCSDAWIARFQPDGTRDWLVRFGTDRRESIPDMAWDTKNSRLLVLVSSGATVGGNGLSPQVLAVTPVTGALATLWESVGDDQNKNPGGLHVDASGNIYVQGRAQFKMPGALSTRGLAHRITVFYANHTPVAMRDMLEEAGVKDHMIRTEEFDGYEVEKKGI